MCPGPRSGREALVWPDAGADALVERVRSQVGATRRDDEHGDLAGHAVGERDAKHAVTHDDGGGDIWGRRANGRATSVAAVAPAGSATIIAAVRLRRRRQDSAPDAADRDSKRQTLLEESERYPHWFHSIDLGEGVVTRGVKTPEHLASELNALRLPDLNGRTVLDIGAWDGFYSFEAERRGAAKVVALDRFVWAWDQAAERAANPPGGAARPRNLAGRRAAQDESAAWWDPVGLPGKHNFDLVHRIRGSRVKPVVADFVSDDLSFLGTFDVVLFLGVLYHMQDVLGSLRRLAELTSGMAIVETEARVFAGAAATPLVEYLAGHYVDDPTNWWAPNEAALRLMFLEAGFATVEIFGDPPDPPEPSATEPVRYRTILHAHKRPPQ